MPTCSFCKKNYLEPRGLTVFTFDGRAIHFCSSKCRRNLDLKRDPKKVNWVKRIKKDKKVIVEKGSKSEEKVVEKGSKSEDLEKSESNKKEAKKE